MFTADDGGGGRVEFVDGWGGRVEFVVCRWLGGGEGTTVFSRDRRISLIMNQHLVFT